MLKKYDGLLCGLLSLLAPLLRDIDKKLPHNHEMIDEFSSQNKKGPWILILLMLFCPLDNEIKHKSFFYYSPTGTIQVYTTAHRIFFHLQRDDQSTPKQQVFFLCQCNCDIHQFKNTFETHFGAKWWSKVMIKNTHMMIDICMQQN